MNYYQHHIGDFIRDTARLSDSQCMAYLRLIWMYYDTEQPIPNNQRILAFKTGASVADVELILEAYFTLSDDAWHHSRCDSEIAAYWKFCEGQKEKGKKGGRPKKNPTETHGEPDGNPAAFQQEPDGNPEKTPENPNHYPLPTNQLKTETKTNVAPSSRRPDVEAVFSCWQQTHNHHRSILDKKRTKLITDRIKEGYSVDDLCLAIRGCKVSPHHMGQNDTGTVYDSLDLILRDASKVDQFIGYARNPPQPQRNQPRQASYHDSIVGAGKAVFGDLSNANEQRIIDITPEPTARSLGFEDISCAPG
jgi:uncharacterized protein YdaU (DUF1376 family)